MCVGSEGGGVCGNTVWAEEEGREEEGGEGAGGREDEKDERNDVAASLSMDRLFSGFDFTNTFLSTRFPFTSFSSFSLSSSSFSFSSSPLSSSSFSTWSCIISLSKRNSVSEGKLPTYDVERRSSCSASMERTFSDLHI
jgi:hypothetical protein